MIKKAIKRFRKLRNGLATAFVELESRGKTQTAEEIEEIQEHMEFLIKVIHGKHAAEYIWVNRSFWHN